MSVNQPDGLSRGTDIDRRVGMRVRALRLRRGLGLRACAELCGRTEEWLRRVERGELCLDRLSTVAVLARVLGVADLGLLVGERLSGLTFSLSSDGRPVHQAVPAIRRVLSTPSPTGRVAAGDLEGEQDRLRARLEAGWVAWHQTRRPYTALGVILPDLIADALVLHREWGRTDRRASWALLAGVFQMAQRFLYCVGEPELAARAADRAMVASDEADDPLLRGVSAWTSTMAALSGGRLDEACDVATGATATLRASEPSTPTSLSLTGALDLFAAIAFARLRRTADAWRHWDQAEETARILGPDHHDDLTMFSQANTGIYAVALDIETGHASAGITRAHRLRSTAVPSTNRRAQHGIDVARGHACHGGTVEATNALLTSEAQSAETILYSGAARDLILDLISKSKRKPDQRLLDLAIRIHLL